MRRQGRVRCTPAYREGNHLLEDFLGRTLEGRPRASSANGGILVVEDG